MGHNTSHKRFAVPDDAMNCEVTPPGDVRLSLGLLRVKKVGRSSKSMSFKMRSAIRSEMAQQDGGDDETSSGTDYDFASPMNCSTPMNCTTPIGVGHTTPFMMMTPELSSSPRATNADSMKLFPLFRPLSERKTLHIIRHGESEYNAADRESKSWQEIMIFDPRLTERGRLQAKALRGSLNTMKLGNALWVVSPLTRALETFQLACPKTPVLKAEAAGDPTYGELPRVAVLPDLTEHLMTAGDIGRPAEELIKDFPFLKEQLGMVGDRWWYSTEKKRNCPHTRVFHAVEPKDSLKRRVDSFRRWLSAQEEHTIVAVGHSMFWKEFLPEGKVLKNCEVHTTSI